MDVDINNRKEELVQKLMINLDTGNIYLASYDEYYFECTKYKVHGFEVLVKEDRVVNLLDSLSEKKRNVLILTHLVGLTDEEIAESLNIKKKTLSEYKSRLMVQCKELLDENG